ncbi:MAG: rhodanese-like domain-containing protein [Burkholderiales bacterium]|nr:rhodanese-like domain-containing protein [Burkholderiales bacterium]
MLDVRTAEQYAQGHLPRARNIPAKELPERLNEIERLKNKPLIVAAETDAAATGAARLLKSKGFTEVLILEGGIEAWRKAELPLEK